jgi:hypothetical protein
MQLNYSLAAVDVGVLRPPTVVGYMVDDDIIWGDDSISGGGTVLTFD